MVADFHWHEVKAPPNARSRLRTANAGGHPVDGDRSDVVGLRRGSDAASDLALAKNHERMVVHRPHPRPQTSRATVRDIAAFLRAAGVGLDDEE